MYIVRNTSACPPPLLSFDLKNSLQQLKQPLNKNKKIKKKYFISENISNWENLYKCTSLGIKTVFNDLQKLRRKNNIKVSNLCLTRPGLFEEGPVWGGSCTGVGISGGAAGVHAGAADVPALHLHSALSTLLDSVKRCESKMLSSVITRQL